MVLRVSQVKAVEVCGVQKEVASTGVARSVPFLAEIASGISHLGRIYCYYEHLTKGFLLTTSVCVRKVDYEHGRHVSSHFCSTASHLDVAQLTLGTERYNVTYKA